MPAYKEFIEIDAKESKASMDTIDVKIKKLVDFFNKIPGVSTKFSCEGMRYNAKLKEWKYGPIWFPGNI